VASYPASTTLLGTASTRNPPVLTRRDFLADVADALRGLLPETLVGFVHTCTANLLKVHYGNDRIHYEVMIDGARNQIEVGLHFEDGPVSTAAYLAFFDRHIVELKHELGQQVELERWTASWGHLYEIHPLGRLDGAAVGRVCRRLAALISAAQPLLEAANVPPERSAQPAEAKGPWRQWRRGRR
jgi:hypothetical protein